MSKEIWFFLLGLAWVGISLYVKGKNAAKVKQKKFEAQQKKEEKSIFPPIPIPFPTTFEEETKPFQPLNEEEVQSPEFFEEETEVEQLSLEVISSSSFVEIQPTITMDENVEEENLEKSNNKVDFDLRKAIIYQTILEKKYC